jgi:hypothetical protein
MTWSEFQQERRRQWRAWGRRAAQGTAIISGTAALIAGVMGIREAVGQAMDSPQWPASRAYVDTMVDRVGSQTSTRLTAAITMLAGVVDDLAVDNARRRVETLTLSLANLQATSSQLAALLTANPNSSILRLQLDDTNDDITSARTMLSNARCNLNRKLQPGFQCLISPSPSP